MKSNKIIIGTRGSILALAQAEKVKEMLINKYDELRENESFCEIEGFEKKSPLEIELKVIVTKGDKDLRDFTKIKAIRGNIHTRLKKLDDGEYDAIVLAAAGLKRVGLENRITEYFDTDSFMPAPGQGILCIQCRENDNKIRHLLEIINDDEVTMMCEAEREFSKIFDGGCHTPIGCSSVIEGNTLKLKGMFNDNGTRIFKEVEGNRENPKETAQKLAEKIKKEEMKNEKR